MLTDKQAADKYKLPLKAVELMRALPNPNYTHIPGYPEIHSKTFDPFALARPDDFVDLEMAEQFIELYNEHIKIPDGTKAGQPMCLPWWLESLALNVNGWYQPDGYRRYNEVFIYVPKKNNKTSGIAGWAAIEFRFFANHGAQFYSAAANREQAGLLHKAWCNLLHFDETLSEGTIAFGKTGTAAAKSIVMADSYKSYKPLSRDANTGDGVGPDFLVGDEIHRHADGELMTVLKKSQSAKLNAISIETTTADFDRPSLCNRMVRRGRMVAANDGDPLKPGYQPRFFPCMFEVHPQYYKEFPECWKDIEVWKRVNPNWGLTVHEEKVRAQIQECIDDPSQLNETLRLNLNIVTQTSEVWMPMDKYDACQAGRTDEELKGKPCWFGFDISSVEDLTSFCLAWKHPQGGYDLRWWFWLPDADIHKKEKDDAVPYTMWEREKYLELIPGNAIDQEYLKQRIFEICKEHNVCDGGADPFNNSWLMEQMIQNNIDTKKFPQNAGSITEPARALMTSVVRGNFRHGGNPVARWNFSNAVIRKFPNDTFRMDKDKCEQRIDGVVAAIMAVGCAMAGKEKRSAYATRGVAYGTG